MESSNRHSRSPIIAAFAPGPAEHEPVDFGLAASRITGAPLVIVAVQHGVPVMHEVVYDHDEAIARLRETLEHAGIHNPDIRVFDDSSGADGLVRAIDEIHPELIVLGVTRKGARASKLLGTTAQRVIHEGACPVAIVPTGYRRPEGGVRVIGAAYGPTEERREVLEAAVVLARAAGTRVRAITVLNPKHAADQSHGLLAEQRHDVSEAESKTERERAGSEAELTAAVAELGADVEIDVDVLVGAPAECLIGASRHVDMLIMGSSARGPKRTIILGSVSRDVLAGAACPVLVLPRGAGPQSEALLADAVAQAAGSD